MNEDKIDTITPVEEQTPATEVVPTPAPEPTPPINVDEIKASVKEEVVKDMISKLSVGKTEEQKAEIKKYFADRNPRDWDEVISTAKAETLKAMEERETQKAEQSKLAEAQTKEQEALEEKNLNSYWDSQFEDLEKRGKLPVLPAEIKDKIAKGQFLSDEDKANPAVKARYDIYSMAIENGYDDIKHAFYELYEPTQVTGRRKAQMTAPVSAGKGSFKPESQSQDLNYDEIHSLKLEDILMGK